MNQGKQARGTLLLASALLCGLVVSGCSTGAVADATATPSPTDDGKPAAAEGTPVDSAIAATCATVSTIGTTLDNARQDHSAGTITAEQYIALVESAYTGYLSLTAFPESQRGLRDEFEAVVEYIEANPDTASGARFDSTTAGYYEAQLPIMQACRSNLSELAIFSTTGG